MAADDSSSRSTATRTQASDYPAEPATEAPETVTPGDAAVRPEAAGLAPSRYQPIHFHAAGNLGEVFLAQDPELHRSVALKRIQERHAANPASRRRFLREAEITGRLEHPGVVPVHGLGQDADGRPCYAMRFIQGESLQEAIERFHGADKPGRDPGERRLALRQLLSSFVAVCKTMAYAHSRGILHRDLKPANIMLGKFGETLVVDWGLAKAFEGAETAPSQGAPLQPGNEEGGSGTQTGTILGTPAFASPEQAAGHWDLVGPPSDIFSLGATLYNLLTNASPYSATGVAETFSQASLGKVIPPRQRNQDVPRGLEAICLKAMARQREDRYGTALALADDVEHWLADEPVAAYREPGLARLRRWGRRHRPWVVGAIVLLVTATAALGIGLVAVNEQKNRTVAALAAEKEAKETAQTRERETRAVLDFVKNRVFAAARPKNQERGLGYDVKLADAVQAALPFVETGFWDQPLVEAQLRITLGSSFAYLGKPEIAAQQFEAARVLFVQELGPDHPDTLASMQDLANSYAALGRHGDALKLREETLAIKKVSLGPDHPDTLTSMNNLANSYDALGRHADALPLREETLALQTAKLGRDHPDTLASMNNLAVSYDLLGRHDEAFQLLEETLPLRTAKLGPDHPDTLATMNNLANSYEALGRRADALKLREETLVLRKARLGPNHPATLKSMNNLAASYTDLGRHADALKLHEETLTLRKAKLGPNHPDTLKSMGNIAESLMQLQRDGEAMVLTDEFIRRATGKDVDPRSWVQVMDLRLRHFQKTKDEAGCRQTAARWEGLKRTDAGSLYRSACFRSVTAAVIQATNQTPGGTKEAETQANLAVAWLQKAAAAGYKNAATLKKDQDLEVLRPRADFKKLLADMETRAGR
jgi:tetratricopeptide (TPR) repeat protein/tRNA A-37 threonylcarbamoyl transferase component Bud32